jgi:hypothetical protein
LGERAETIEKQEDGTFIVTSNKGKNSMLLSLLSLEVDWK